jgi:hypothetical protein
MTVVLNYGPQVSGLLALAASFKNWLDSAWNQTKLAEEGIPIPVVGTTGWKQREQQNDSRSGANRILFLPGSMDSGNEGTFAQPERGASGLYLGNPRMLYTWSRVVTASIWSVDNRDTRNEELQIAASDTMIELVVQGLINCGGTANIRLTSIKRDPKVSINQVYGLEKLLEFVHKEGLFDLPNDQVTDVTQVVNRNPPQ